MGSATKEQIGEIPPNTSVVLGSARFNGREWIYQIYTQDGLKTADARRPDFGTQIRELSGHTRPGQQRDL
jgi:hypothetical protein